MKIDAVILAKSTMWGNFCVAGLDMHSGMWVRFVSYGDGQPLSDSQMMFINDSGSCNPLDVARIRIVHRMPRKNHTEDCMIERDAWLKLSRLTVEEVLQVHEAESYRYIFGNGREYVDEEEMRQLRFRYSLILIKAENLRLYQERNLEGKVKYRAEFIHNNRHYSSIRVTDPEYTSGGSINLETAYLVMSMPAKPFIIDGYMGRYYKLIAKILPPQS